MGFKFFSDILFPVTCPVCKDVVVPRGRRICGECKAVLPYLNGPVCFSCGQPVSKDTDEYCDSCAGRKRAFERSVSVFSYTALLQRMIGDFKFRSRRDYVHFFADELEICYKQFYLGCQIKALVPVPIHPSRKRFRGYNQSELLCRELSKRLDLPVYDCLKRQRKTAPQKGLSPEERRKNLFDAMSFEEPKEFVNADYKPECVLIVDDIFTTGATSEACADILKMNGIERVYVLNIATGNKIN